MIPISKDLTPYESQEITRLLSNSPNNFLELQQIWQLMDQVWDEMGCDNQKLDQEKITAFYQHPVWLLNGFFIQQHDISLQHRHAISDWVVKHPIKSVLDFGGGFGTLARMIADKNSQIQVDIYEPYPSNFALSQCKNYSSINFVNNVNQKYDCLISTDVLEHVPDPLDLFAKMIEYVNLNGYLVIANCFYPVIKCHLPSTFHFRYTFNQFAELMGLKIVGKCQGSHATIYQKIESKTIDWQTIRRKEYFSRIFYHLKNLKNNFINRGKNRLNKIINKFKP